LSYYVVHDFMYKDLELTGTDLSLFALIYSYKEYYGSLSSMCLAVGAKSITTIQYSLKRLIDKGLILKSKPENKFSTCTYQVNVDNPKVPSRVSSSRGEWTQPVDEDNTETKIGEW